LTSLQWMWSSTGHRCVIHSACGCDYHALVAVLVVPDSMHFSAGGATALPGQRTCCGCCADQCDGCR
jgi:hypothetical protein